MIHRRGLLMGLGAALVTAPAIVRAASLMPVKAYDTGLNLGGGNDWHHWAVTRRGGNFKLFVNGVPMEVDALRVIDDVVAHENSYFALPSIEWCDMIGNPEAGDFSMSAWVKDAIPRVS